MNRHLNVIIGLQPHIHAYVLECVARYKGVYVSAMYLSVCEYTRGYYVFNIMCVYVCMYVYMY